MTNHVPPRLLTDLPDDVLASLPRYLHSLEDLHALILSCRRLHTACSAPVSRELVRLAKATYREPHLLTAMYGRRLAAWAAQSAANRSALHAAIASGPEDLLGCALRVAGPLSLPDLVALRRVKRRIIDPLNKILDGVYKQSVLLPLATEWLYCELFHDHVGTWKENEAGCAWEALDAQLRDAFIRCCVTEELIPHHCSSSSPSPSSSPTQVATPPASPEGHSPQQPEILWQHTRKLIWIALGSTNRIWGVPSCLGLTTLVFLLEKDENGRKEYREQFGDFSAWHDRGWSWMLEEDIQRVKEG